MKKRKKRTFADWFRTVRHEKGLTQSEAAQELKVSFSTVSRWESGAEPRASHLRRIALWADLAAEKLLGLVS